MNTDSTVEHLNRFDSLIMEIFSSKDAAVRNNLDAITKLKKDKLYEHFKFRDLLNLMFTEPSELERLSVSESLKALL